MPDYKFLPVYADIVHREMRGSWPEGKAPTWVQERYDARPTNPPGDTELAEMALRAELDRVKGKQREEEEDRQREEAHQRELEEARQRDEVLARRAQDSTELEERALADFTTAIDQVRGKLARALGMNPESPWEVITPKVESLMPDMEAVQGKAARAESERESVLMALKVVRDVIVEADKVACEAVGHDPTPEAEYASDLVESVRRLAHEHRETAKGRETERTAFEEIIAELREEVRVLHKGDEGVAAEWKAHVWRLAAMLDVPRPLMGQPENPNVDQIVRHIGKVVGPLLKLQERIEVVEKHLQSQVAESPDPDPAVETLIGAEVTICTCGTRFPTGVIFCPNCGKDASLDAAEACKESKAPQPVRCSCGSIFQVAPGVPKEDIPGLCPTCGGRHQS